MEQEATVYNMTCTATDTFAGFLPQGDAKGLKPRFHRLPAPRLPTDSLSAQVSPVLASSRVKNGLPVSRGCVFLTSHSAHCTLGKWDRTKVKVANVAVDGPVVPVLGTGH